MPARQSTATPSRSPGAAQAAPPEPWLAAVAEGVETREWAATLQAMGLPLLPGFYYCQPCTPDQLSLVPRRGQRLPLRSEHVA